MSIKAGDLRHPVTLLRPVRSVSEKGRPLTAWEAAADVYAAIGDVSGREFYEAQAYHAENTVTFTLRWRDDLDATWRIRHHGQVYEIIEVNHLGYKYDFLRLKTRALQGEG